MKLKERFTSLGVFSLLAKPLSNPKVAKNGKVGVLTAPLHLAPASLSGFNVCAQSTVGCRAACLHTAGNPAYMTGKTVARIGRTKAYFNARPAFMAALALDIAKHVRAAERQGMAAAVRLNATSDIAWERVPVEYMGQTYPNLMTAFPDVSFYDYTKITKRAIASISDPAWPANYKLTYSATGENDEECADVLARGGNVAAVFAVKRGHALPLAAAIAGRSFPTLDGDEHDYRPIDLPGHITALRAKGKAIGDLSGFVRAV